MKSRTLLPILAASFASAMIPLGALAQSPPDPPGRFAGAVTVNGAVAPANTQIEARIGAATCGTAATSTTGGEARYVLDVPATSQAAGCGTDGASVTFYVGGVQAGTGVWHNYQLNTLNLAATTQQTATPPPATTVPATTTRVATPSAPQTGTGLSGDDSGSGTTFAILAGAIALTGGLATAGVAARRRR